MKKIISLIILLTCTNLYSQQDSLLGNLTPGGYLDTLFDQNGQKYPLKKLSVNSVYAAVGTSCSAGYFNIYYAVNSGFEQLNNPTHSAKRSLICKLFTDISNFIKSPLSTPTNTARVNILIADPALALIANPGFLGGATVFYVAASNPASANPGIVDTEVYKTIISGTDSYVNVAAPLTFLNGNQFYHAQLVFNPNVSWNLNVSTATMANQNDKDLWSVALHEIGHMLGFGSNINYGGGSLFGPANNYYARYDKFLYSPAGLPLITSITPTCINMSAAFNVSASVIAPASCSNSASNITNCSKAVHYIGGSANVAVFTPSCWASGSSLSHFEDICSSPSGFSSTCTSSPVNNDLYFTMSNAGFAGDCGIKRYFKPEERSVFCDLGYSVNAVFNASTGTTYASTVTPGAYFNYSTSCNGNVPLGINDGLALGNYLYSSATNTLNFPLNTILANDFNTATITCLQTVYNNGTVTIVGNAIKFVAAPGVGGPILLRYLPKSSGGVVGNITYIHGFIVPPGCTPVNACDLVQNGGFESMPFPPCGTINATHQPNCWAYTAVGPTPDIYGKACSPTSGSQLGSYISQYSQVINTHNPANSLNNNLLGLLSTTASPGGPPYLETLKNYLSSPLQPNGVYVLNCWLLNPSGGTGNGVNTFSNSVVFSFLSDQSYGSSYAGNVLPGPLTALASFSTPIVNGKTQINKWIPYTKTFTFTGTQSHNVLYLGVDAFASVLNGFIGNSLSYVFVDDISIIPIAQSPTITLPTTVACTASTFTDLALYAQPSGGVFSGPGVVYSGGKYSFNAAQTLTPGTYGITYSYTTALGCNQNYSFPISILPYTGAVSFVMPAQACQSTLSIASMSILITPTLVSGGIFTGAGIVQTSTNPPIYVLNGNATSLGIHSYTYTNASCAITLTASTTILPAFNASITSSAGQTCLNPSQSATLTATSNSTGSTYSWLAPASTGSTVVITPTSTTIYTLTAQKGQCSSVKTITAYVVSPISFLNPPPTLCTSTQWFQLYAYLAPGSPTAGTWSSGIPPFSNLSLVIQTDPVTFQQQAYAPYGATPGTYSLAYTYTAPGCGISAQLTVNVIMSPTLTTNGPLAQCINFPNYSSTLMVVSSSTLPMTYTWNPGNIVGASAIVSPTANTVYTVMGTDGTCTSMPAVAEVNTSTICCGGASVGKPFQYLNSWLGTSTLSGLYAINQDMIVTGTVSIDGEYYIAPNVKITIAPGGYLSSNAIYMTPSPDSHLVNSHAHLLSCTTMWNGIEVKNGGAVKFETNDLIEDAKTAITSNGNSNLMNWPQLPDIQLDGAVFNRNRVGVAIKNYTQTAAVASPFNITGCVFTCRSLPYITAITSNSTPVWETSPTLMSATYLTPMASPYLMSNFPAAYLKAPYASEPANAGVYVENSGITSNPTATNMSCTYITIGDGTSTNASANLFDNLNAGISALNSNIACFSNIYQNTRNLTVIPTILLGTGIRAINNSYNTVNYNSSLEMVSAVNSTSNINRFYDCHIGVQVDGIFQVNMKYAEIRSTQTKINQPPITTLPTGLYGVYIVGNKFKNYMIHGNKFLNVMTGVYLLTNDNYYNMTGALSTGQVWGSLNIQYNLFSSAASAGANPGSGFMNQGVYAVNLLSSKGTPVPGVGFYTVTPNNGLRIQDNNFDQVYRGVFLNNFSNSIFGKYTVNNLMTITQDHMAGRPQTAIEYLKSYFGVVNSNTITGFNAGLSYSLTGIYYSMNTNSKVECNSLNTLLRGTEFASTNSGTTWKGNTMQNISRGMQLSSAGIIGAQGSVASPSDNYWAGSWSTSVFHTYAVNSAVTISPITKRTLTGYNPLNNGGFPGYGSGSLFNGNNSATWPLCVIAVPIKGPGPSKSQTASFLVNSQPGDYPGSYPAETYEINRFLLYRDLQEDDDLLNSDPDLQNFFNANQVGAQQILATIEELLSEGDLSTAGSLLATFTPTSTIEGNYKRFFEVYLSSKDSAHTLTVKEKTDLDDLAHKCPFIDGPIVYQARALNNAVTGNIEIYNDYACDNTGEENLIILDQGRKSHIPKENENQQNQTTETNYYLFPNPATDKLFIRSINEKEELSVEIRDLNNRLLSQTMVLINNYRTEIKLNLINGVYFVILMNRNNTKIVKKLIISK